MKEKDTIVKVVSSPSNRMSFPKARGCGGWDQRWRAQTEHFRCEVIGWLCTGNGGPRCQNLLTGKKQALSSTELCSLQSNSLALAHVSKLKRAEAQDLCHLYCLQLQRLSGMFLIQAVIAASHFLTYCPQGY